MKRILKTIVRDTGRYSVSNSSSLTLPNQNDLTINKLEIQGGATATTEDIVVTRSGINLLDKNKFLATQKINGLTFTNNGDGTITADGTATKRTSFYICSAPYNKGHKVLLKGCPSGGEYHKYFFETSFGDEYGKGAINTLDRDILNGNCYITIGLDFTASNLIFKPQLYDLTAIYGEANEPTTVEQFLKDYPEYEPYLPPKSLTFSRDYLLSLKGVNNLFDKNTFFATGTSSKGVTFTNNGDGTITVNGTATATGYLNFGPALSHNVVIDGHKCLLRGCPQNDSQGKILLKLHNQGAYNFWDSGSGAIGTIDGSLGLNWGIAWSGTSAFDNLVFKPELFDLTAIYGEGNEPTTVEQFLKTYPLSSTDKLTITKNSVKYNDTDITSEITGLDDFFSLENDTTVLIDTSVSMSEITADTEHSVISYKRAVYTGKEEVTSSQTFIK